MIAFVFPGQGAQKVGMGKALAGSASRSAATAFDEADAALGESLSALCFEGPDERLLLTENTQPAILAMSVAVLGWCESRGVRASFAAGHSLGEYSAHVAAGTLSFADALRTVRRRGRYMQEAVPVGEGAMAAILGLDADGVARACAETMARAAGRVVTPANLNAPGQVVIAGHADAVRAPASARRRSARSGRFALAVSAPFHCALMKPAEDRLAPELRALPAADPRIPVVANVDAEPKRDARVGNRGADAPGVFAGALGGGRQAAHRRGRDDVRRAGPGTGARGSDQEDRSRRDSDEHRGRGRARARDADLN